MYADPKRVRGNRITINLDDYEHKLVIALADYQGEQPAALVRELVMREAQQHVLGTEQSVNQAQA
jgi:hypothetical protein